MGYSEDLVKELKGVGKISPGAADSFSREFNRIVTVAEETLNRGHRPVTRKLLWILLP